MMNHPESLLEKWLSVVGKRDSKTLEIPLIPLEGMDTKDILLDEVRIVIRLYEIENSMPNRFEITSLGQYPDKRIVIKRGDARLIFSTAASIGNFVSTA